MKLLSIIICGLGFTIHSSRKSAVAQREKEARGMFVPLEIKILGIGFSINFSFDKVSPSN